MSKILIIGPIGDFGGRELECSFIASALSSKFTVEVCTTGSVSSQSQIYDFNKYQKVFSLNDLVCEQSIILKLLSIFSYSKNNFKGNWSSYANNGIAKKYFNYYKVLKTVIEKLVKKYDVIFICAQLSSSFMSDIVSFAKQNNKRIIFRTTGTIHDGNFAYIENLDLVVHHSIANAINLEKYKKHQYSIIDQYGFDDQSLLNVFTPSKSMKKFLIVSRLSSEKGVEQAILFFLQACNSDDILFIAGNGSLEDSFRNKYKDNTNIKFKGFVDREKLLDLFNLVDCLIICSPEESGPLVGVEAMGAGKIMISTKVGAMPERLSNTLNQFWFDYDDYESFKKAFESVKVLTQDDIFSISKNLREKYFQEYSMEKIKKKYLKIVSENLNKKDNVL